MDPDGFYIIKQWHFFFTQLKSVGLHIWQTQLGFGQAYWSGWVPSSLALRWFEGRRHPMRISRSRAGELQEGRGSRRREHWVQAVFVLVLF